MIFGNKMLMSSSLIDWTNSRVIYSLRLVNPNYTGNCIRVRRSSDSTEMNIGFSGGVLDTATLLTFVGSGFGYVRTWYDQSGNAFDLAQTNTSYQPMIVESGNLIYNGSKICIKSQGKYLSNGDVNFGLINRTMLIVFSITDAANANNFPRGVFGIGNTGTSDYSAKTSYLLQLARNQTNIGVAPTDAYFVGADNIGTTSPNVGYYVLSLGDANLNNVGIIAEVKDHYTGSIYFNGALKSQDSSFSATNDFLATSANGLVLGSRWYGLSSYASNCKFQEFIYFNETKPDYATYIADINNYYNAFS